jgi:hypothetical protein
MHRRRLSIFASLPWALLGALALLVAPQGASAVSFEIGFEGNLLSFDAQDLGCGSAPGGTAGQLSCEGADFTPLGGWTLDTWNLFLSPNPTVSNSFAVTNNTASTQTFVFSVTLPVSVTFGPPSLIKGSIGGSATDNNGDGVTVATSGGISLYRALIDGSVVRTLHDDPFSASTGSAFGTASIPVADFGIPNAESVGVATTTDIGIILRFTLSPGDSAAITSVFNVEAVPEPGMAMLLLVGLAAIAGVSRTRR